MVKIKMHMIGEQLMLTAEGHAGYAPRGLDIVCAGVSTLINTLLLALDAWTSPETEFALEDDPEGERPLKVECTPTAEDYERVQTIFRTIQSGLAWLETQYPDNVELVTDDAEYEGL